MLFATTLPEQERIVLALRRENALPQVGPRVHEIGISLGIT